MKTKKQREFSKIIAVVGMSMWVVVTIYVLVMMAIVRDLSPVVYVIGSVDAVVAVISSFYFWKAKAENQIKLKQIYGDLAKGVVEDRSNDQSWS